ncbi:MAG: hypothetical protein O2913_14015 [Chloroflexi bacterium]|nr:hypothetical protein [Chloroflexota bacterium]
MAAPNNPRGSKSDKLWRDAIMVAVKRETNDADGKPSRKLALLADKLVNEALNGNVVAMKEIGDRLDGKASQEKDVNVHNTGAVSYKHRGLSELLEVLDECERAKENETPEGTLSH